ncbi:UNVERIFIED_CONTAM: hypothetical protein GTU68_040525, partial [Idotea baltica]|nr:hypothetical protein [Idotea baltica]
GLELENASADFAQIAIQGPKAEEVLSEALACSSVHVRERATPSIEGLSSLLIARTGYTGEDGFEVFLHNAGARQFWNALLVAGEKFGIKAIGLAARDTLRLEACYPLHGHEISDHISPLTAGLGWVVKLDAKDFLGADALRKQKEAGLSQKLVALKVRGSGIVREETPIFAQELKSDEAIGKATSGTKVPSQDAPIALAIISAEYAKSGTMLSAEVRGRRFDVEVVKKPIYKR